MKTESLTRNLNKVKNWGKKNSPELLIAGGIIGIGVSVVLACRATMKSAPIVEEAKEELKDLKETKDNLLEVEVNSDGEIEKSDKKNVKKDTALIYGKTALKVAREYAPSAVIMTFSIAGILGAHKILKARNIALAAAYTTLDAGFKSYRERVSEQYGEETENDIYNGFATEKITVTETDSDGKEVKTKEKIKVADPNLPTPYARYFHPDYSCYAKAGQSDWNYATLLGAQNSATVELRTRGSYTLAQLYRELGFPITPESLVIGWVFDEKGEERGDNVVDLGITECYLKHEDGTYEKTFVINPNYDGYIANRI